MMELRTGQLRLTTAVPAACTGGPETFLRALRDHLALELRERPAHADAYGDQRRDRHVVGLLDARADGVATQIGSTSV
jgi:hypothetical protein